MTNILYLAKDDFFLNVIELTLQNYQTNIEFSSPNDFSTTKLKDKNLVILDSSFNGNPFDIIKTFTATNIPVIFLYDELNAPENLPEGEKVISIPQTFIEEKLIDSIQKFCKLEPKSGDENMAKADEKSQEKIDENGDVIELTDIIDENEISDIFSTEEAKKETQEKEEAPLDTFDEILEKEEIPLEDSPEINKEEKDKQNFDIVEEEHIEKDSESTEKIAETMKTNSPEKEQEDLSFEEQTAEKIEEENIAPEEQEEIKIPVDEETIKLAKEIEEENITPEEQEEIKIPVDEESIKLEKETEEENISDTLIKKEDETPKIEETKSPEGEEMKKQDDEKTINISSIETKLFQASEKVLEAIEEATIEIAKGIAKVTPKIIEEVSKEIIPRIAQRIISEEIYKQFNQKLNDNEEKK